MRHTLFKILVCICLCVVFLIVLIVELPGILINRALGLDGSQPTEQVTIVTVFETVTDVISNIIGLGYDSSMTQVETLIADGGYDYELSMNALVNHAQSSAGYDVAYIMSAYSTSVDQLSANNGNIINQISKFDMQDLSFFSFDENNLLICGGRSNNNIRFDLSKNGAYSEINWLNEPNYSGVTGIELNGNSALVVMNGNYTDETYLNLVVEQDFQGNVIHQNIIEIYWLL